MRVRSTATAGAVLLVLLLTTVVGVAWSGTGVLSSATHLTPTTSQTPTTTVASDLNPLDVWAEREVHGQPQRVLGVPICPWPAVRGRQFWVAGTLQPHFPAGTNTVTVTAYRFANGAWKQYMSYAAVNRDSRTFINYVATVKIAMCGTYRFQASTAATTEWSAATSGFSDTLLVW